MIAAAATILYHMAEPVKLQQIILNGVKECSDTSVFVPLPLAPLITALQISPFRPMSFFSHVAIKCPCYHMYRTTPLPEINTEPMEARTKTIITHEATNSLAITAYFIHYWKQDKYTRLHTGANLREIPISHMSQFILANL